MTSYKIKHVIADALNNKALEYFRIYHAGEACGEKFAIALTGALENAIDNVIAEMCNGENLS